MNNEEARPGTNQNGRSSLTIQESYHCSASLSSAAGGCGREW
jgi:hypothetical protein